MECPAHATERCETRETNKLRPDGSFGREQWNKYPALPFSVPVSKIPYRSLWTPRNFSWSFGDDNNFRANLRMTDASSRTSTGLAGPRLVLLLIHVAQIVLAITALGLSAYAIHYVAYNILIYSVVVASSSYLYFISNAAY